MFACWSDAASSDLALEPLGADARRELRARAPSRRPCDRARVFVGDEDARHAAAAELALERIRRYRACPAASREVISRYRLASRVASTRQPLPNLRHLRLQLGIGVLPQIDEVCDSATAPCRDHPSPRTARRAACGRAGRNAASDPRALEIGRAQVPLVDDDRRIGFAVQVVRAREHRGVADRAARCIGGTQLHLRLGVPLSTRARGVPRSRARADESRTVGDVRRRVSHSASMLRARSGRPASAYRSTIDAYGARSSRVGRSDPVRALRPARVPRAWSPRNTRLPPTLRTALEDDSVHASGLRRLDRSSDPLSPRLSDPPT